MNTGVSKDEVKKAIKKYEEYLRIDPTPKTHHGGWPSGCGKGLDEVVDGRVTPQEHTILLHGRLRAGEVR